MRCDQVSVDGQPQDAQTSFQIVSPDRRVPRWRGTFQDFGAPDVVDQHIDVAVVVAHARSQTPHLRGVEVINLDRDPHAAKLGYQLGGLLDGLGTRVIRPDRPAPASTAAPGADHCRTGLTQAGRNAASRTSCRAGHHRHPITKCTRIWRPCHNAESFRATRWACR